MASPHRSYPAPNIGHRCENDHCPPDFAVDGQPIEESKVQSQKAVLDRPGNCPEQHDNNKLISNVDIALIDQRLSPRHLAAGGIYQIVERRRLESL